MEQLILIGIILFVSSLLDAAARKMRAGQEGSEPVPLPPPDEVPEVRRSRASAPPLPSYDHDPSFDDAAGAGSQGGRTTSEGLIPADVWEEIQALARGGKPAPRPAPPPQPAEAPTRAPARAQAKAPVREVRPPTPPMSTVPRRERAPAVPEVDAGVAPEHFVHATHAKYGKPVQDRLTGFDEEHRARGLSPEAAALRRVLRGGGAPLRQAILLQEILGPPVSLKDDPSAG